MSLKALIDAAEYVDKDDQMSEENNLPNESPTSATAQRKLSGDSTITHWRKRAVAQSVMELNNKTSEQSSDHVGFQDAINCNGGSFQELHYAKNDTTAFPKGPLPHGQSTLYQLPSCGGSVQQDCFNSLSINSEDAVTLSSNAYPSSSPLPSPRKSTASSPHGTTMNTDPLPESPKLPHNFPNVPVAFLQDHGEGSGSEINGNFGWPDASRDAMFGTPKKRHGSVMREAHNQLEKSRRKHLKQCYDGLRGVIPNLGPKTSHLIILREALKCIQILEERHRNLREYRISLSEENMMKQKRLQHLKDQLSKYMGPTELEKLLMKPSQQMAGQIAEEDNPLKKDSVMLQDVVHATTKHGVNNSWVQKKQIYAPINGFVPVQAGSAFPPLSSALNLVNEARRLCTVLPSLRVQTSSEVQKNSRASNAKPAGTFYQPINYPSSVRLSTFHPNSTPSPFSNVRAYTGFGVPEGSNFMQANPLKIVVKQVDSAKQQARVSRPIPTSDAAMKRLSNTEQSVASKSLEMRNSSVPPFSRVDHVFSRVHGRDVASPPLLSTDLESGKVAASNVSKAFNNNARRPLVGRRAVYCRPRSKSDIEDLSDDSEIYIPPKKHRSGSSYETFPSNSWKLISRKRSHRKSVHQSSESPGNAIKKTSDSPVTSNPASIDKTHPSTISLPELKVPVSMTALSNLVNPSDSVTRVSFTTLNSTKPAIPSVDNLVKQQDSGKSPDANGLSANSAITTVNKGNDNTDVSSIFMPKLTMPQNMIAMSMAQNIMPVMMPVMASPSMSFMMPPKSVEINSTPGAMPAITVATQTIPTSNTSSTSVQRADAQSQMYTMKPQVPQFQYMMPMAFPGMMAGSNCSTMMMQAPMTGFFPMMPQGQGWGFMMPQGMMMMSTNQKSTNIQHNGTNSQSLSKDEAIHTSTSTDDKSDCVTTSTGSNIAQSSSPSSPSSSNKALDKPIATGISQVPQQFSMMPNYQNVNHCMMPMPAGQNGGFYFGGAPSMMPAPGQTLGYPMPMNIVGFPMQFGGSNSFPFAFPGSTFNAPAQQPVAQPPSDDVKPNATDSSNRSLDKG